jgi:glycosyltransferase involved in cell wall biosynthesis
MVIHSDFPATGGAEIQAARLSAGLLQRGWQVRIVALGDGEAVTNLSSGLDGIPIVRLRRPAVKGLAGAVLIARFAWHLYREREQYDVIHVHIMKTLAFVAGVMGRWLGKKVVLKVSGYDELDHGMLSDGNRRHPYFRLLNWGCRRAEVVVATSRRAERRLRARGYADRQVLYLPNGVDVDRFRPAADKQSQRHRLSLTASHVAVFVGRFVPEKGLYDLLEAWTLVRQEFTDALLCLVGDGKQRPGLEALVRADRYLRGTVYFAGESREVEKYLSAADCYVCSSHSEGLSNTMIEAMAAGLPIVSTAISGAEDVVREGENGYLVPVCDPEKLADAIKKIFADPVRAEQMEEQSRATAVEFFALSKVIDRYERIYRSN